LKHAFWWTDTWGQHELEPVQEVALPKEGVDETLQQRQTNKAPFHGVQVQHGSLFYVWRDSSLYGSVQRVPPARVATPGRQNAHS
jgi:hypothetical protein